MSAASRDELDFSLLMLLFCSAFDLLFTLASPADFPFAIDRNTGELFAKGFIDRETKENYNFEVTVSSSFPRHSA